MMLLSSNSSRSKRMSLPLCVRAGDGQGRQRQGRVTDGGAEHGGLARGLRRPKPDPARGSAGTWRNPYPISVGREVGFGAQPEGCHRSGTTGVIYDQLKGSDLARKVARSNV